MTVSIQLKNTKLVKIETDQTFDVVTRNSYMYEIEKISYVDFTFKNGFCLRWMNYHASDFDSSSYSYYDHILGCGYLDKKNLKSINYYEKDGIVYEKENL